MNIAQYLPQILIIVGSFFAAGGIYNWVWWIQRDRWETCTGSIQKIVKVRGSDGDCYYPVITGSHRSSSFRVNGPSCLSEDQLELGAEVMVTYDPVKKRFFVYEGGFSIFANTALITIFGFAMIAYGWSLFGER